MECIYRGVIGNSCSSLGLAPISVSDPFGLWRTESHFRSLRKVARRGLVFQLKDTVSPPQFSLRHAHWGLLTWPLELYSSDDEYEYYTLICDAEAKWEFLHEPQDWKVVEMDLLGRICKMPC